MERTNRRNKREIFFSGEHKNITTLKHEAILNDHGYLHNSIPRYPEEPEFHISKVAHVTNESKIDEILDSNGFRGGDRSLLWWSLAIEHDDIRAAEDRYLEKIFPDRTPEQREMQREIGSFLNQFTTSPAFKQESRYGNYRFTLSLSDLLKMYREQICGGEKPVLKVYETSVYQQEIMYCVLVHSPSVDEFEEYPCLGDGSDDAVCGYKENDVEGEGKGHIVWRAQAMSATQKVGLTINAMDKIVETDGHVYNTWYMWDHVTLALHLPEGLLLNVDRENLIKNLTACEADKPFLGARRLSLLDAQTKVQSLNN
ncbi:uncharacterized protein LOC129846908 [Salvelinus fontinalis]|uniref:uncharacterized protein LOC129846908 n=1 Tax=Salvelinus fontinalis TaxID=8038 RepID=UPI002486C551|nr:uncharacterized protein LOC129846908 [Salvelinus fontinalis]